MNYSIFFIVIGMILAVFMIAYHEKVHQIIYEDDGIKSHVEWFSHFPDVATIADEPCKSENCVLANNINDVVGYHLIPIFLLIFFGIFFFLNKFEDIKR